MSKKTTIIILSSALVLSYAGFFVYQRIQRAKADKANDTLEDALKKLQDAKGKAAPLYSEPSQLTDTSQSSDTLSNEDAALLAEYYS
jgi:hypothetical protein